jgi:hypothetical protein
MHPQNRQPYLLDWSPPYLAQRPGVDPDLMSW